MRSLDLNMECTEENILDIINKVRQKEKEDGLTEEEIENKYINMQIPCDTEDLSKISSNSNNCALVRLVNDAIPNTRICMFGDGEFNYYFIGLLGDIENDEKLINMSPRDKYYYDISGKRYYYAEIKEYLGKKFNTDPRYVESLGEFVVDTLGDNSTTLKIRRELLQNKKENDERLGI